MTNTDKIKPTKLKNALKDANKMRAEWVTVKAQLEARRAVWDRISPEQRKAWVDLGNDPIITLALEVHAFVSEFVEGLPNG